MRAKKQFQIQKSDVYRTLFFACLFFITVLSIMPDDAEGGIEMPHFTDSGFFMHVFAYMTAAFLGWHAFTARAKMYLFLLFYSSLLEFSQRHIAWRSFNYWDIVANVLGVLIFATAAHFLCGPNKSITAGKQNL